MRRFSIGAATAVVVLLATRGQGGTYQVSTTADSGAGSLRSAINLANSNAGADDIVFAISGTGPFTISVLSALPNITDSVHIDGTTQPGYPGSPLIELDGTSAGSQVSGFTFTGSANLSIVRGMCINRFGYHGITAYQGAQLSVFGCYLGSDPTGMFARPNLQHGIRLLSTAGPALIGGPTAADRNLISGNNSWELAVSNSGTRIINNYIGTDVTGNAKLSGASGGIGIGATYCSNIQIGGTSVSERNVIAGNSNKVALQDATSITIQGNYLGAFANGSPDGIPSHILVHTSVSNSRVGGLEPGAGNLFMGHIGIWMNDYCGCVTGNAFLSNRMYTNVGVSFGNGNPNLLQSSPVLTGVTSRGDTTTVTGTLNSTPNSMYRLQFFGSAVCAERGEDLIGEELLATDGSGAASFTVVLPEGIGSGRYVNATATDLGTSNTSRYTSCAAVSAPKLSVSGSPVTFPLTKVSGGSSPPQDVTLSNSGNADLSLTGPFQITGPGAAAFQIANSPSLSPIAVSGSRLVQVTFDPTTAGLTTATLAISSDDPLGTLSEVLLSGTAGEPEIEVTGGPLNFGIADGPTTTQSVTVHNYGSYELSFSGIALAGEHADSFEWMPAPSTSPLGPGQSRTLSVRFNPSSPLTGMRTAEIAITSDDMDEQTVSVPLTGYATGGAAAATDWHLLE